MDTLCAEVLLSGLLFVSNNPIDYDVNKGIYYDNGKSGFVLPSQQAIYKQACSNERYNEDINKSKLKAYIKTIE